MITHVLLNRRYSGALPSVTTSSCLCACRPFLSLSRQERWQRAHELGLAPPVLIANVLATFPELTESTFAWQESVRAEVMNSSSSILSLQRDKPLATASSSQTVPLTDFLSFSSSVAFSGAHYPQFAVRPRAAGHRHESCPRSELHVLRGQHFFVYYEQGNSDRRRQRLHLLQQERGRVGEVGGMQPE